MNVIKMRLFRATLVAVAAVMCISMPVKAIEGGYDPDFFSANDIVIYDPRATTCGVDSLNALGTDDTMTTDVDKDFTLGTDNSLRAVNLAKQMMADFSLTEAQAAGIVGNFMHESGGQHVPPDINEGGKAGPPRFSGGYGWAQWTGSRQTQFINYAIKRGYMGSKSEHANDAANYAWLKYELIMTERSTLPAVGKTSTPKEAATAFEANFERAGVPALTARIKYANVLYKALKNGTGIDISSSGSDSSDEDVGGDAACEVPDGGIAAGGKVFDQVVFPLQVNTHQVKNRAIFKNGTTQRGGHPYIAFDILADAGTTVLALTSGTVTAYSASGGLAGSMSIYNSEKKLHVFYTHMLPKNSIKVGDKITMGQPLGVLASVKKFPAINADHLHIDAGTGKQRLGCSRGNPNGPGCKTRVDIGPDLFNAWQTIKKPVDASDPV